MPEEEEPWRERGRLWVFIGQDGMVGVLDMHPVLDKVQMRRGGGEGQGLLRRLTSAKAWAMGTVPTMSYYRKLLAGGRRADRRRQRALGSEGVADGDDALANRKRARRGEPARAGGRPPPLCGRLLAAGASVEVRNFSGDLAHQFATEGGHPELAALLQAAHNYEERGMDVLLLTAALDDRSGCLYLSFQSAASGISGFGGYLTRHTP